LHNLNILHQHLLELSAMLRRWFVEDKGDTYAYQWEHNESVVEWLETQKLSETSTANRNINAVRKDAIISQIQRSLEVRTKQKSKKISA
jgi:acetyl-CoA carboxylase/biotin carboxylase 1